MTVLRRLLMLTLLALIVLRPTFGTQEVASQRTALSVLVVLDRTTSMTALDVDGRPRLARVRADLATLVDGLPEARFAVVTFATDAELELPFTSDTTVVEQALEDVDPESPANAGGSRLDRPLEEVSDLLDPSLTADRHTVLVLMSDGENTAPGAQASYEPIGTSVDDGVVLGYGTPDGGPMRLAAGGFVQDRTTGTDAVSRLDATNLRSVATELGVPYVHRDRPEGMEDVVARLAAGDPSLGTTSVADRELTWAFALGLSALLLLELRGSWRALVALLRSGGRAR